MSLGKFSLARLRFPGRNLWFTIRLATLFVSGQGRLIPQFFVIRLRGWVDTFLALIVPSFFSGAFGIFLLHLFFQGIPEELVDAVRVDGASPFHNFLQIFVPVSAPLWSRSRFFRFCMAGTSFSSR
jgi:multiple sugar transport system permease protein